MVVTSAVQQTWTNVDRSSTGTHVSIDLVRAEEPSAIRAMMPAYLDELVPGTPADYPQFVELVARRRAHAVPHPRPGETPDSPSCAGTPTAAFHELAEFYVLPRFRRMGVGRAAAAAAVRAASRRVVAAGAGQQRAGVRFWRAVAPPPVRRLPRCAAAGRAYSVLQFVAR